MIVSGKVNSLNIISQGAPYPFQRIARNNAES